jgi:hypothetical protein
MANDTDLLIGGAETGRKKGPHAPLPAPQVASKPLRTEDTEPSETVRYAEESSRARAARRAAELRNHRNEDFEANDKFAIDPKIIPDGWEYQWKLQSVLGQSLPTYEMRRNAGGWEPVPLSRHPELMPKGWKGDHIEMEGQILCERPMEIEMEARQREKRNAQELVGKKEQQVKRAPAGDNSPFETTNKGDPVNFGIRKSYSPIVIPNE